MSTIGERIREYRAKMGLSQAELAEKADIPRMMVSHIESDKANPTLATLEKISSKLGIPMTDLFTEVDHKITRPLRNLKVGHNGERARFSTLDEPYQNKPTQANLEARIDALEKKMEMHFSRIEAMIMMLKK
jgi:transcriptional regulator with XRE-family HTH domain